LIAKITNMIGMPVDWAIKMLPKGAGLMITQATEKALALSSPSAAGVWLMYRPPISLNIQIECLPKP
jgi:hypothetical protein